MYTYPLRYIACRSKCVQNARDWRHFIEEYQALSFSRAIPQDEYKKQGLVISFTNEQAVTGVMYGHAHL